ncbi:MAG: STAS domain-containing protein [Acidimicrobiia bacterium]|nr:STAS domain-containing protein [Acidimicrobiia bacterium]
MQLSTSGTFIVAHLKGAIDVANAATIESELCHAVPNTAAGLIIDLAEVSFMDSSGLRVLFVVDERLRGRQQGLRLVLAEGSNLSRTLALVHMQDLVPICEDVASAAAADTLPAHG